MRTVFRRVVGATLAVGLVASLAACGESEKVAAGPSSTTGEGKTSYPLTVENCGTSQKFDGVPARVVSLDQGSTEILLSLGLADRIVGTATWTDPVLPSLAEANSKVKRLSDNAPSYEAVMGTNPTFVTASFGRHFKKEGGVAPRERFAETNIQTYLSPTDCVDGRSVNAGATRTTPLVIDSVYQEITELARIFDVQDRGRTLVDQLKARMTKATQGVQADGRTVGFWFADTRAPYFAGGYGAPNLIAVATGLKNVVDQHEEWPQLSWSAVVEKNPDILVLGDLARNRLPGDKLADKTAFLESDPVTRVMTAVQGKRYLALHGAELNPSIRVVDGVEKVADYLKNNPK